MNECVVSSKIIIQFIDVPGLRPIAFLIIQRDVHEPLSFPAQICEIIFYSFFNVNLLLSNSK